MNLQRARAAHEQLAVARPLACRGALPGIGALAFEGQAALQVGALALCKHVRGPRGGALGSHARRISLSPRGLTRRLESGCSSGRTLSQDCPS